MTATDRRIKDPKYNLEVGDDKPNIPLILHELEQAQSDAEKYFQRSADCFDLWHSRWEGQTLDGRKHAGLDGELPFPYEGAADGRMRTCERVVNEFITIIEFAFDNAKVQAQSVREFAKAREVNQATRLLRWQISGPMRSDMQREIPLAIAWTGGYGSALLGVDWEQSRRLDWIEINLPDVDTLMQSRGNAPAMAWLMDAIMDPNQEEALVALLQQLSPILQQNKTEARKIIRYLRMEHVAKIPVANVFESRPRIVALRPMVDVIFPAEMDDPQSPDTRWMDRIYYVTETQAYDRIDTDGWDEQFVDEAVKRKGQMSNERWMKWTSWERSRYAGEGYSPSVNGQSGPDSYRDLIEIHEFRMRVHHFNVPCLYKTVFSPHVVGPDRQNPLYAKHGADENDHNKFPYAALRFEQLERPLLSSRGIPEICYTWEQEEKAQADGITDRTGLVLQPPLIVPKDRQNAVAGQMRPGAVLGVTRPNEFQWMKLPQFDNTPILVQERVDTRIQNYFGWFGAKVDPDLKQVRRQRTAKRHLNQLGVAIDLILQLDKQYLPDDEVAAVVGNLQRPFHVSREDIAGAHQISATVDMQMLNEGYAMEKLDMLAKAMPFNQGGTGNLNKIFSYLMETIDPDLADAVVDDSQTATARETQDERGAINAAFNGMESPLPMYGNHQLRLQTIMQDVFQSQNPRMQQRLMQNPDTMEILKKRVEFHQNQIQQYQQNPQIGRALSTQAFAPKMAPQLAAPGDQG